MLEQRFGRFVPSFVLRRLMGVETAIDEAVRGFARETPAGERVLDAGAGEGRHREIFGESRYVGVDLAVGDAAWDYTVLDCLADLEALPFGAQTFDRALSIVVLEHVRRPGRALAEIARALKPGGLLLLVVPQQWEVHQAPHDYFRFTRHGLEHLLEEAGMEAQTIEPLGGHFSLLSRRLVGSLNFFHGGWRWLAFPFAAAVVGPLALLLPSLDRLDSNKETTPAYRCLARKL